MSYQVIARKWRPQTFAEMVGQVHITQTLGNALKSGRVHHALLFTGPRGTGKTSSARILAKALRCPNAVDFVPCNVCDSCIEIAQSRSMDVQELDAASNNSVDDVRKLLEGVMSSPSSGKWKIYIIDEVHMLSTSAFNALLKTLEEPPAHVLFILATTEAHKIPETILSRCLRFDFKRIPTRQITDRLRFICESEGITADDEALWLIARQGDGSMRDSLSLLDQVITFAAGGLSKDTVTRILGLTDRSLLFEVLNNLMARDTHAMLKVLEKLSLSGTEPRLFANELLESLRHLIVIRISGSEMSSLLELPDSEMKSFAEMGAQVSEEDLHLLFDMALKGANDIPRAQDPRLVLEVMLLRMAAAPRLTDLQSLLGRSAQPRGELRPGFVYRKVDYNQPSSPPTVGDLVASAKQASGALTEPVVPAAPVSVSVPAPTPAAPAVRESLTSAMKPRPPSGKASTPARPGTPSSAAPNSATGSTTAPTAENSAQPRRPGTASGPVAPTAAPLAPAKKVPPRKAAGATPAERWLDFVEIVRTQDEIFAAKIESLLFLGETGTTLRLSIPPRMVFLRDQLENPETRQKLKAFVDSLWGEGYSFEVLAGKEAPGAKSAQGLAQQKHREAEDELKARIHEHPLVKAAQKVFQSEIKAITPVKTGKDPATKEGVRK